MSIVPWDEGIEDNTEINTDLVDSGRPSQRQIMFGMNIMEFPVRDASRTASASASSVVRLLS